MIRRRLTDSDLHAYADNRLDTDRRLEVEAWLARDPEAVRRVGDYRFQSEALHEAFDGVLAEPESPALSAHRHQLAVALAGENRRNTGWAGLRAQAAAATILLMAGGVGGFVLRDYLPTWIPPGTGAASVMPTFADVAVRAHAFYAAESRFPVEMSGDDPGALDAWLSHRLGQAVAAPDLMAVRYHLIGGRLLPTVNGVGAQYMYEDESERRITLFVGAPADASSSAFSFVQRGSVSLVYWGEGTLAYALIGEMSRNELLAITRIVYQELRRKTTATGPSQVSLESTAPQPSELPERAAPSTDGGALPVIEKKPVASEPM